MKNFIKHIRLTFVALGLVSSLVVAGFASQAQAATVDVIKQSCTQQGTANSALCSNNGSSLFTGKDSIFLKVVNTIIFVLGSVAVIMIIIGGIRYTLSAGDSGAVNGAKNTILYAVIGMAVAILSFAIVNFVITRI